MRWIPRPNSDIQAELRATPEKGRTVLTIAHRLSTIVDADQIIVLEDGVIVEQGHPRRTHRFAQAGRYAGLWARQSDLE